MCQRGCCVRQLLSVLNTGERASRDERVGMTLPSSVPADASTHLTLAIASHESFHILVLSLTRTFASTHAHRHLRLSILRCLALFPISLHVLVVLVRK